MGQPAVASSSSSSSSSSSPFAVASCYSKYRRWILYIYSFVCVSLVAGLIYGWPALRRQLLEEGSDLDEKSLGAIFTVGAWSTQGGRFFTGLARDRFGTRWTVAICFVLVIAGNIGIAISDANNVAALAISLFAVGLGSGVQLCIQPVAGLFPTRSGTILSSLSGAFQISGLMFLALTSASWTRTAAFLAFSICLVLLGLGAIILFPKGGSFVLDQQKQEDDPQQTRKQDNGSDIDETEIATEQFARQGSSLLDTDLQQRKPGDTMLDPNTDENPGSQSSSTGDGKDNRGKSTCPEISEEGHTDCTVPAVQKSSTEEAKADVESPPTEAKTTTESKTPTAWEQLKCLEYILLCTWFSITIIPLQYYVGSIGYQLEQKGDDDGFYTNLFAITYAAAAVVAPAGGYVSDKAGLGVTQGLGTVLVAFSLLILASDRIPLPGQGVGLAFYGIGRMFVFGMFFANAGKRFGYSNYGTLAGLGLLTSAIASLLQYPLIAAAADGKASAVNISCGTVLLTMTPYFIWLYQREKSGLSPTQ